MRLEPTDTVAPPVAGRRARKGAVARRGLGAVLGVMVVALGASMSSTAYAAGSTVNVGTSATFGTVLTNAQGLALYTLPSDHNGMSTCTGPCVSVWPALTVPAATTPTAGTGVPGTVASVLQADGTYQVTYNSAPLYTFVGDTAPGQVSGNNVGGFKVVQVATAPTPTTSAPAPTAPTTGSTTPTAPTTPAASTPPTTPAMKATAPPAPATAAGSGTAAAAPSGSSPAASNAPTSLAVTGPGPGLVWMVVVGAVLVASSVAMLWLLGDRNRLPRTVLSGARRAGRWVLGR